MWRNYRRHQRSLRAERGYLAPPRPGRPRLSRHVFAFSGLIDCGHCGCSLVGEIKKKRYVYYHCTGYKGRCGEPYVCEEVLKRCCGEVLGKLTFDDEVLDWVREALHASHADEKREREAAIAALQAQQSRLQHRLETILHRQA